MKIHLLKILLVVACVGILANCKKKNANTTTTTEPEPTPQQQLPEDTAFQVTREALAATFAITDMEMLGAFLLENTMFNTFYQAVTSGTTANTNTVTFIRDTSAEFAIASFNQSNCLDGKLRNGSVFFNYSFDAIRFPNQDANSNNYRDPRFAMTMTGASLSFGSYYIEELITGLPAQVYSNINDKNYDPATTPLSWTIDGKFKLSDASQNAKVITWEGKIVKTITNSTNPQVFSPSKTAAINWSLATVSYSGTITGSVGAVPYTLNLNELPVIRDFNCAPEAAKPGYHPFTKGMASFTSGSRAQKAYFNTTVATDAQTCDNIGKMVSNGRTYNISFIK